MTSPPVRPSVRPTPQPTITALSWGEQRLAAARGAAADALKTIADKFPMLGRRRLGIRWAEAYRIAVLELQNAGLLAPRTMRGEGYRWNQSVATPSAVRQIHRRFSTAAQKAGVSTKL